jgi:hypothetical protein
MSQPVFDGPDNLEVQAIGLDGRTAEWRVRRHGIWMPYTAPYYQGPDARNPRTIAELATLVDLGTLKEREHADADRAPHPDPNRGQVDAGAPGLDDARAA